MRTLDAFVILSLLAACGSSSKTSPDGGTSSNCGPGTVDVALYGGTISSTCFQATTGNGLALSLAAQQGTSPWGTGSGIYVDFASDAGCSYAAGDSLPLTDPCLQVTFLEPPGQTGVLPQWSEPDGGTSSCATASGAGTACSYEFWGATNLCDSDVNSVVPDESCAVSSLVDAGATTGTLTINQWSTAIGGTVKVTLDGTLTGYTLEATSGISGTYVTEPLSITGTAQAVVQPAL